MRTREILPVVRMNLHPVQIFLHPVQIYLLPMQIFLHPACFLRHSVQGFSSLPLAALRFRRDLGEWAQQSRNSGCGTKKGAARRKKSGCAFFPPPL